jgi:hypothetical protein
MIIESSEEYVARRHLISCWIAPNLADSRGYGGITGRPASFDTDVAAVGPTELCEALKERRCGPDLPGRPRPGCAGRRSAASGQDVAAHAQQAATPPRRQLRQQDTDARHVAARPGQAGDEPSLTGSSAIAANKIGMVAVALLAAKVGAGPPPVTITATRRRTRSAASSDN